MKEQGVLRSFILSRTMSFLRSNDLIYTPAIKSYMMGETPPAFDLLYWNGDGSNLPAKMSVDYLRGLCQRNEFVTDRHRVAGGAAAYQRCQSAADVGDMPDRSYRALEGLLSRLPDDRSQGPDLCRV